MFARQTKKSVAAWLKFRCTGRKKPGHAGSVARSLSDSPCVLCCLDSSGCHKNLPIVLHTVGDEVDREKLSALFAAVLILGCIVLIHNS